MALGPSVLNSYVATFDIAACTQALSKCIYEGLEPSGCTATKISYRGNCPLCLAANGMAAIPPQRTLMKSRRFMRSIHPTLYTNLPHWLKCRLRVKSAVSTVCQRLPVCPEQRTSADRPRWSGSCQMRKSKLEVRVRLGTLASSETAGN